MESDLHADSVRVAAAISDDTLQLGEEELSISKLAVQEVQGKRFRFLPCRLYFLRPGVTVVNEAGRAVGRVRAVKAGWVKEGWITLDRKVRRRDFPDRDGDGRKSVRLMVIGPGDTLVLHQSARLLQAAK